MPVGDPLLTPPPVSRHPVDVGLRTEAAITRALVEMGHQVFLPVGQNQRYDLLVEVEGTFYRCQCKTGRLRKGAVRFNASSVRCNTRETIVRDYLGEIDYFLVYCEDTGDVYALSMEDGLTREGHLRVDTPANNQQRGIRWAADHRLPRPTGQRLAA